MSATKDRREGLTRREALRFASAGLAAALVTGCTSESSTDPTARSEQTNTKELMGNQEQPMGKTMRVHYLEIVTEDVSKACEIYGGIHGVSFGDPDQSLGGARTATMSDGSMIGVRARMHDQENLVTRAYLLVDDIAAAVAEAEKAGALIALPPMEIPGHGTCAIYIEGGIEAGLWQV